MDRHSSRAITALLVAIVSIPLSTQAIFRSQDDDGRNLENAADIREEVLLYHTTSRHLLRRAYSRAIEDYRDRLKAGETDAVKPEINDPSTFRTFLDDEEIIVDARRQVRTEGRVHEAAPEGGIGAGDLTTDQRMLLRAYTRAGVCPPGMENVLPGFYALCKGIVGDGAKRSLPRGMQTDLKALRSHGSAGPATIRLRLRMLEQAKDPSNRRTDTQGPLRPTPYTGEKNR
jgi:hypothetical protein